jgi:hypothetical protein
MWYITNQEAPQILIFKNYLMNIPAKFCCNFHSGFSKENWNVKSLL